MNWRSLSVFWVLAPLLACATSTNGGIPPDLGAAGSESGGAGPSGGASAEAGASAVAGAPSTAGTGSAGSPSGGSGSAGSPSGGAGSMSGAGAGGHAGSSSGGKGGSSGSAGAGGSAGSGTGGGTSSGPCANPKDVTGGNSGNIPNAAGCYRTIETFNTVGCSNWGGRTLKVNGVTATCGIKTTFPAAIGGYNYFDVGPGTVDYGSFSWFSS